MMPKMTESSTPKRRRNPLLWIGLLVVGLILFILMGNERGKPVPVETEVVQEEARVEIDRSLLIPPGMRAREYIAEIRAGGEPFPMTEVFARGMNFEQEGNLADAHLLFFFSAREDYIPAIMKLGEMSDPQLFRAENSLLDHADAMQAYKWYQKAADLGHEPGKSGVISVMQWANAEAELGNPDARQLLLNFK
jgi:hypothetical protein